MSSIRSHQLLLAFAVLVPAVLFVTAAWWNRAEVLREGEETAARTAAVYDEHARKVFDTADLMLAFVEERMSGMSWEAIERPETSAFLRQLTRSLEQLVSIWVADENGVVHAGSHPWNPANSLAGREWFEAHRRPGIGTYVGAAFTGRATHTASFAVSRRLRSPDGSFVGTVHVALSPDYFARFFREAAPPFAHASALFRADGALLAREPPRPVGTEIPASSALMRNIAAHRDRGQFRATSTVDGRERIYAYRRVAGHPVYVGFGVDVAVLLQRWYENVQLYGLVTAAAAVILLFVSWLALQRARAEQVALRRLRHESEQRLNAEQQLVHAHKMESIGQLTGGIAHDFNNLLAVILGNLRLIRKAEIGDGRMHRLLDGSVQAAERGAALTQRLLAFARRQELSPRDIDVPALFAGMSDLMRRSLGPEIQLVTDFPPRLSPARADPNQLELALLNLMVNARDAMPQGGTITIAAREERICAGDDSGLSPGRYVCITVRDTGSGMDAATLERATEPFFTTKGIGKGTGLGLSMVQGLAIQSGGTFRLTSRPGEGTTAAIWLPQGEREAARPAERRRSPSAAPAGKRTVLLVDDDILVAMGTAAMLEDLGHEAIETASGAQALKVLAENPAIDLVITDQSMPGMTGLQLARRIRERWPHMPILLASGHAELPDGDGLGLPRLPKPFQQEELADALAALPASRPRAAQV